MPVTPKSSISVPNTCILCLGAVCLPLNEALNGSDLLVQHLMVQTVCFTSRCLNDYLPLNG
ncbi:hypothetical protein Hanom_Chr16g01425391 [Helianthus anomalus]